MVKYPEWVYRLSEEVLVESIRFPTVLGDSYGEIVDYYGEVLKKYGLHVSIIRVPDDYVRKVLPQEYNPDKPRYILIARTGKGEKVLQFNGHYDVVSPGEGWSVTDAFKPLRVGDRIYGRGSTDMKGGIASFISALAYLAGRDDLDTVVEAAIVPDEEIGGLTGTGYLVNEMGSRPKWVVIAEPSGVDNIWIGHKGLVWGYVKTYGVQAHGSTPWLGDNAFEKMVHVARFFIEEYYPRLKGRRSSYEYDVPYGEYPSITLGGRTISPGNINIVPGVSGFSVDRRLIVEEKADHVVEEIESFVKELSQRLGFKIEFQLVSKMDPALTKPDTVLVRALSRIVEKNIGSPPRRTVCVGGLDMRYYTSVGVETATYGPGEPGLPHKADEYIVVDKMYSVIDTYIDLAYALSKETS